MNAEFVLATLIHAKETLKYLYVQGIWPKGAFRQWENQIQELCVAIEEVKRYAKHEVPKEGVGSSTNSNGA